VVASQLKWCGNSNLTLDSLSLSLLPHCSFTGSAESSRAVRFDISQGCRRQTFGVECDDDTVMTLRLTPDITLIIDHSSGSGVLFKLFAKAKDSQFEHSLLLLCLIIKSLSF